MSDVTTTDGSVFTHEQSADLAYMVYERFGHDIDAACDAWSRMLQNDTCRADFVDLLVNALGRMPHNESIRHLLIAA